MFSFIKKYRFYLLFIGISIVLSYFIATHIGLFDLPDGFFYYNLGAFLLYGRQPNINPFNITTPQTLFGPFYSILLALIIPKPFPWAMTGIPFLQVFAICIASLWVFIMAKLLIGKKWALLSFPIFLSMPFMLVYATSLMSEALTIFLMSTYSVLFTLISKQKTKIPPSLLVFVACLLTLTKNAYVLIVFLTIPLWIFFLWRDRSKITPIRGGLEQIPVLLGFIGIMLWVRFNKTYHDIYSLTNYTGRHLYNNVVHSGHLLPDKNSDIYKEFFQKAGDEQVFYLPEWEAERIFVPDFNEHKITEAQIDKKFMAFSTAAIKNNPLGYATHLLTVIWGDITTAPYHAKLLASLGKPDPECTDCGVIPCRTTWDPKICQPQYDDPFMQNVWAGLIYLNRAMYPYGMAVLAGIAAIGIFEGFRKRNWEYLFLTGIFLLFLTVQAAAQRIEGRYMIPLFPLFSLCVLKGIQTLSLWIKKRI